MKLLLLNYEFPPMGGGAGNATYEIARELVKIGHSVDVLTSRFGDQPDEETLEGIRVYRVSSWRHGIHQAGLIGAFSYILLALIKLRGLLGKNQYDLTHYFFSLPTGVLSFYSHGIKGIPYIVSLRGSDVPGYDTSDPKLSILHRLLKPVNKRIWRQAERVIANSQGLKQLASKTSPDQAIGVICNGIDIKRFKPDRAAKLSSNGLRLLSVSRLIGRKGLDCLIDAVSRIKDTGVQLDIVGTGSIERQLKQLAKKREVHDRIHFHGYRSNSELVRLYNSADIFVQSSLSESINMALLEAMSCGLPIVASRVGGVPEIIQNGKNGILTNSGDSQDMAKAIRSLIDDPSLRSRISENNLAMIREKFGWNRVAERYQAVYEETAG